MPSVNLLRPALGLVALLTTATALTACGSASGNSTASTPKQQSTNATGASAAVCDNVKSGSTSQAVKVTGTFGKTQTATFAKPLKATSLERTVTTLGSSKPTTKGQQVNTLVTVYLGSGKKLGTQPLSLSVGSASIPKAFTAGAACLPVGSRSIVTDVAKDVYGAQGNPQVGIKPNDTMVIVTDVISVKKPLVPTAWTSRVPSVSLGKGGKPTVKLPKGTPPSQLEIKVLKKGTGATVRSGDQVTLDYQGTSWTTGKIFDQSYGRAPATFGTDQVVQGFGAALVGQKVGTRLLVNIPAKYAYGPKSSGQQLSGQDLVFYIDIHKTSSPS